MVRIMPELVVELVEVVFFALGTAVLSGVGVYLEEFALSTALTGEPLLGAWIGLMGLMAFYFGPYLMGYDELRPRVALLRRKLKSGTE
jgi:hypothetical protein